MLKNQVKIKEKFMKKFLVGLLTLVLCFTLVGCGEKDKNNENNNNGNNNNQNKNNGNKEGYEYTYTDGVLTQIVDEEGNPKQTDFVLDGIILVGNRHSYEGVDPESEGLMNKLVAKGYNKEGINSEFYLNEYIEFYIDTKYSKAASDVKVLVTPHKTVEELEKMSLSQLEELATSNGGFVLDFNTPDAQNYMYFGEGYVNMDYPEGKYDILFTYKGKLAYFININLTKEPTE